MNHRICYDHELRLPDTNSLKVAVDAANKRNIRCYAYGRDFIFGKSRVYSQERSDRNTIVDVV